MNTAERQPMALAIMETFARRTGLSSDVPPIRYLWTDAFAVCNYVGLHSATGDPGLLDLAVRLVDQVHELLGRHRGDDDRSGWISGLSEGEGAEHPTIGGLRIGKPRGERGVGEPWDPQAEWDLDGQYYHYLTKWLRALCRVAATTGEEIYAVWALELAVTMDGAFVVSDGRDVGLRWKMSVDLSRPLVSSMGHHDPLDGLLAVRELMLSHAGPGADPRLRAASSRLDRMCKRRQWATDDALGIGGLLVAVSDCHRLVRRGAAELEELHERLIADAERSLRAPGAVEFMRSPLSRRLGFRELGLAIGLAAVQEADDEAMAAMMSLRPFVPIREAIEAFWLRPESRSTKTWAAHRDISEVMLATSLAPEGFLGTHES